MSFSPGMIFILLPLLGGPRLRVEGRLIFFFCFLEPGYGDRSLMN